MPFLPLNPTTPPAQILGVTWKIRARQFVLVPAAINVGQRMTAVDDDASMFRECILIAKTNTGANTDPILWGFDSTYFPYSIAPGEKDYVQVPAGYPFGAYFTLYDFYIKNSFAGDGLTLMLSY